MVAKIIRHLLSFAKKSKYLYNEISKMDNHFKKEHNNDLNPYWETTSIKARLILTIIAIAFWTVVIIAWNIVPDAKGFGSHQQIGIPKCQWIRESNTPCPTCGMTTAYSLTVRGRIVSAFLTQPAGCILAITHIILTGLFSWIAISGKYPFYFTAWVNYNTNKLIISLIIIILLGWFLTYLRIKYFE